MAMKWANILKNSKNEISGTAADVEHSIMGMQMQRRRLCHQVKD
jgi:hypothetical protein